MTDSSLKEYYVKLNKLYENAVNMLTALNQSLTTNATHVSVNVLDTDDAYTTLRIPSFLNIEARLEQLDLNFGTLFNMPASGDAWFTKESDLFKLQMINANTAPASLQFNTGNANNNLFASITDNNILKDMVSPKTFLKLNIQDLPSNIHQLYMKKLVIYKEDLFYGLQTMNMSTHDEYVAALYNYTKGIDYDEYESLINLPIRKNKFKSLFKIINIPSNENFNNPWLDEYCQKYHYEVQLDTLQYTDADDSAIIYTLKVGDKVCLNGQLAIYNVKSVNINANTVELEESVGHINLQTIKQNDKMFFEIYNNDYSAFNYAQIPLEENQYICIFIASVYDNVRSQYGEPLLLDLNTIYMRDAHNQPIYNESGNPMTYMQYYKKYCVNIGDLILGLTQTAYPQVSNYTTQQLSDMQEYEAIQDLVTQSINETDILQVVPINKHLTDDVTNEDIINLHTQKNNLNSQLNAVQSNIDQVYNTLITTDFKQTTTITQLDLQSKLQQYYTERTTLTKQMINVVNNINAKSEESDIIGHTKYRIRGISDIEILEKTVKEIIDQTVDIVGMDLEYKYKSVTKDSTNVAVIEKSTFTDWNKQYNIDRQRILNVDPALNIFSFEFDSYKTHENKVKWNQINVPIQQGEDVIIRVRYKYNIGQPFVNLYTPWSDEIVITFPQQYTETLEVVDILNQNRDDSITARFNTVLINDGYSDHNNNKLQTGSQIFYHMPENIYSGFNTSENNLLSLKDKLTLMNNQMSKLEDEVSVYTNTQFKVVLTYDDIEFNLTPNQINKITITDNDNVSTSFIKKEMNIVIKNTGSVPVKFYSQFPGVLDINLLKYNGAAYNKYIGDYQSVPIFIQGSLATQKLGQWIYFRYTNPLTKEQIYNKNQTNSWALSPTKYMMDDFNQPAYMFRPRLASDLYMDNQFRWNAVYLDRNIVTPKLNNLSFDNDEVVDLFDWDNENIEATMYYDAEGHVSPNFVNRFEDIYYYDVNNTKVYLDNRTNVLDFSLEYNSRFKYDANDLNIVWTKEDNYNGAFIYPNLLSMAQIQTEGSYISAKVIDAGHNEVIPFVFEYYLNGNGVDSKGVLKSHVTKGLYFDLKNSLFHDPNHYMIEITAIHNSSFSNYSYTNVQDNLQLSDEAMNG